MSGWKVSWVVVSAAALVATGVGVADAKVLSRADIAKLVKAHVAEVIDGINHQDTIKATKYDAKDMISMEGGRPPSVGMQADREGLGAAFKYAPGWRLRLVEETVDVPASREMAVYRSTYFQDSVENGVAMTQKTNFLAGFEREPNGEWKIAWQVVAAQEKPHKK
ncbi:MAG TPA: hypothetical protein VG942_08600 [Hyphomonadaceae bacterium]|nr:hypothetical protein [Hyphomonadaceae bacterium]